MGDRPAAESGASVAEEVAGQSDTVPRPEGSPSGEPRQYTPRAVSRRPLGCLIEIAETLILTIIIFWAIQTFVAQPYRVEQESMRTTLWRFGTSRMLREYVEQLYLPAATEDAPTPAEPTAAIPRG